MANLSVEEPYALMRARTGLWEPWRVTARATRPCASYSQSDGVAIADILRGNRLPAILGSGVEQAPGPASATACQRSGASLLFADAGQALRTP